MGTNEQVMSFDPRPFQDFAEKVANNESVKAGDFIEEGKQLKAQAMDVYQKIARRRQETDLPVDPFFADIEELIKENQEEVHQRSMELAYRGKLDPQMFFDEVVGDLLVRKEADGLRFAELRETLTALDRDTERGCKVCYACAVCGACLGCVACAACAACLVTGTVATGAAGATKAAGLTGAAGTAGVSAA